MPGISSCSERRAIASMLVTTVGVAVLPPMWMAEGRVPGSSCRITGNETGTNSSLLL